MTREPDRSELRRMIGEGNASVIGVGQGRLPIHVALPRQLETAKRAHELGAKGAFATIDTDGERGIVIFPKLSADKARELGRMNDQRSVLNGYREVRVSDGEVLTRFDDSLFRPASTPEFEGEFFTRVPARDLAFSFVQVRPHRRGRAAVRGYATRRRPRTNARLSDEEFRRATRLTKADRRELGLL